jgi:hypothetical protein
MRREVKEVIRTAGRRDKGLLLHSWVLLHELEVQNDTDYAGTIQDLP